MSEENKNIENIEAAETAEESTEKKKKGPSPFSRKLGRAGFSIAITAMFIAAVVFLNVIVNTILSRFDVQIDMTERQLFSIEKETAEYMQKLDDNIHFYFCSEEEIFRGFQVRTMGGSFSAAPQLIEIAHRFVENNPGSTISFVDTLSNPQFAAKYGGELADSNIIIESETTGRYRILSEKEYLTTLQYYLFNGEKITAQQAQEYIAAGLGYMLQQDMGSSAEQAYLSAIMSVSDLSPVRVAFTEGFGEGFVQGVDIPFYQDMADLLEKNSYMIEKVNMLGAAAIDPEIDFLIIFAPTIDYSTDALRVIDEWLDNNADLGKNLLYFPAVRNIGPTPNLDAFLAEWGIRVENGYVRQSDDNYRTQFAPLGYEQLLQPTGAFSEGLPEKSRLVSIFIRPLSLTFETRASFKTSVFIQSFEGAMYFPYDIIDQQTMEIRQVEDFGHVIEANVLNTGVISSKTRYINSGWDEINSRIIAFGSPYMFNSAYMQLEQFSNARLLLNIFNELSGRDEDRAVIIPKSFAMTRFDITAKQANDITIIFTVVLPLIIIVTGLVVYFRRRFK